MPDSARVEVHGFRELAAGSAVLYRKIDTSADTAFGVVADHVAVAVRIRVPRRSGRLAGSVVATRDARGAEVGIGGGVPYAGWIEFGGTRGRPYVPTGRYLYPTALAAEPVLVTAGELAAQREIGAMHWPTPT